MGACGSKEIEQQASGGARDISRWKATDEDTSAASQREAETRQAAAEDETLTLNAVVAYHQPGEERRQRTDLCVTGWEDGSIQLQDWKTRDVVTAFKPHSRAVNRIVVGSKTGSIYSCSRDTTVAIGTAPSSSREATTTVLQSHTLNVSSITVDSDESSLCSGGRDTQTILWDLTTCKVKAKNTTAQNVITCSKWLPGERVIAQGSEDLSVKLWDERTALRTPVQTLRGYIYFPLCLDVSEDGHYLLTSSKGFNGVGGEARVWDRRTGKQLHQFEGHQQDATSCCFLSDGSDFENSDDVSVSMGIPTPVTASKDGTVKVWDSSLNQFLSEAHEPSGRMFTSISHAGPGTILASTLSGKVHAYQYDALSKTLHMIE